MKEIMRLSGEKRKGAAVRRLALEALLLKKRREIAEKFFAGKWSVDLLAIEKLRKDRTTWNR
ncbi:MAG: hypothetical protein H0W66_01125 [Chthoniobacterales bacterium]|nr:hypothetical protein [Chthoniobacterales bacterium]